MVDAKPVTARLAHGVLPVQVAAGGQPVVEHPLLQVLHHCLIPPHPVPCSACCPASGKHTLCQQRCLLYHRCKQDLCIFCPEVKEQFDTSALRYTATYPAHVIVMCGNLPSTHHPSRCEHQVQSLLRAYSLPACCEYALRRH